MNNFESLQDWSKNFGAKQERLQGILDSKFFKGLIQRSQAKKEESSNVTYISILLADCIQNGQLIEKSDGQFTGGYSVSVYRYNDEVIEFGYQDGRVYDMTRFDGELY